jgi:C4-dicarboxylate transporter DctM subunit
VDALQTVSLVVGLLVLFGLLALGLPLYIAFAASSIILFVGYAQLGTWAVPQIVHNALDKYVFTAIPMFVMVGSLMDKGGAGDAYFRLIGAFVGHVRGGLAVTAIIACAFFGAVCGSSLATAVAIGAVVGPEMLRAGYPREIIAAVTASGGTLGIIIPPSLAMIILGDVTGTSVGALFIAGIVPGVLCTVLLSIVAYFRVRRIETIKLQPRATARERWDAFVYAIPALIIPAAILGTIYGGLVTPTESAIIAVVLSFAVGVLVYRKLTVRRFVEALKSTAIVTGVIYSLVFACIMFGRVLAFARLPQQITGFIAAADVPRTVFLFSWVCSLSLGCSWKL